MTDPAIPLEDQAPPSLHVACGHATHIVDADCFHGSRMSIERDTLWPALEIQPGQQFTSE
jgi:hypothetical protein